jgi:AcrR family transcriptional regulator
MAESMRTRGTRPKLGGRSARVVRDVLRATIEELGLHGFSALSIETVAQRAQVNKTTIYRRWPTKDLLVRAAFMASTEEHYALPEDGPVRTLLTYVLNRTVERFSSAEGRSIMRMLSADDMDSELFRIVQGVREEKLVSLKILLDLAVSRGELPRGFDQDLLFSLLIGAVYYRLFVLRKSAGRSFVDSLVELTLLGVSAAAKKRGPRSRKARPTTRRAPPETTRTRRRP